MEVISVSGGWKTQWGKSLEQSISLKPYGIWYNKYNPWIISAVGEKITNEINCSAIIDGMEYSVVQKTNLKFKSG